MDERRKSFGYGAAGHGTTGVVLTTVLILCHDEPGHMVGRREQSISVKRRALAFWVENRTRKATRSISCFSRNVRCYHAAGIYSMELQIAFGESSCSHEQVRLFALPPIIQDRSLMYV